MLSEPIRRRASAGVGDSGVGDSKKSLPGEVERTGQPLVAISSPISSPIASRRSAQAPGQESGRISDSESLPGRDQTSRGPALLAVHPGNPVSAALHPSAPRRITRDAGRGLEILGHAIEYLADEYALEIERYGSLDPTDPRLEAIRILKLLNRKIHYSCPPIEPLGWRIRQFLLRAASLRRVIADSETETPHTKR